MPSKKVIESVLRSDPTLTSELRSLVAKIDEDKLLEWSRGEEKQFSSLVAIGVLELGEKTIRVCPSDYLAYGFVMAHQVELLADDVDLAAITDFEHKLQERLRTNPMTGELFRITERITQLWVKSLHIDNEDDLTHLSDTPEKAQQVIRLFCDVLPELNLSAPAVYDHVRQFAQAEIHLPSLVQVVETYCEQHTALAGELYNLIKQHPFENDINFRVATQSGINRQDWIYFLPQLQILVQKPENQGLALSVMFRARIESDQQADQYLELTLACDQSRDDVRRHIASVVQQILRFPQILSARTINQCFNLLKDLAQEESPTVQASVSTAIWLTKGFETELFSVLINLVQNVKLDHSLRSGKTNNIDTILSMSFGRSDYWFAVFDILVAQNDFAFKTEDFTASLQRLVSQSSEGLMSHLLPRLIHRMGKVRWAAKRILSYIEHHAPRLRFSTDEIHKLSPLQQYRLWLTVSESYRQPSFTIPLLLPLLESTDDLLVELISCHLEIASENYMGQVLETLDAVCWPDHPKHQRIRDRVNAHFNTFLDYRRRKSAVSELNPLLTQGSLFHQYDDLRQMTWGDQMHQRLRTDSIAGLFKEVLLSKGGGWRNTETGITSQLNNVQTTFSVPRFYFLRPHEMDFEATVSSFNEEWDDDIDLAKWITRE